MSQAPRGRQPFTESALQDFLKSGWMLSLPSFGSKQVLVGWGDLQAASNPAAQPGEASLFAPDFHLKASQPWRITPYWDLLDRDGFASLVMSPVAHNVNDDDQGFQWVEPEQEEFFQRFDAIQQKMKMGHLQKAVPVVFAQARAQMDEARKLKILQNLARLPSNLFIYGLWGVENGTPFGMMGATPELLYSVSDAALETVAVAGTRGKEEGVDGGRALLEDPKERHEHQLVIDDIRSVLSPVAKVQVDETRVVELPSLFHLKTPIRAQLTQVLGSEVAARLLHPTPALGVAPRALGFKEIQTWDHVEIRGRFGAPFGVEADLGGGRKIRDCVVAIRSIQWQDTVIRLGSGCGVVPQSDARKEWRELKLKRESVKRMLGV